MNRLYLLIAVVFFQHASAASTAEFEAACLQVFEDRAKLLNDNMSILKKSVYSYIPYSDDMALETGSLPLNIYQEILRKCDGQYDVFYASIHTEISYVF